MPYRTERVSGRCRQASHPAPPSKQPPGQGALYVSEDNVTSCAMQAFIAGYCEISLIKSAGLHRFAQPRAEAVCLEGGRTGDSGKDPARQAEARGGEFKK